MHTDAGCFRLCENWDDWGQDRGETKGRQTRRKPETSLRHLVLRKAHELSQGMESRSPENILESRGKKKTRPRVEAIHKVPTRETKVQTTAKAEGAGPEENVVLPLPAPCRHPGSVFTLGESLVTVTRKRNMDAAMPAIMSSNRPWRGFPYTDSPAYGYSTSHIRASKQSVTPHPWTLDTAGRLLTGLWQSVTVLGPRQLWEALGAALCSEAKFHNIPSSTLGQAWDTC